MEKEYSERIKLWGIDFDITYTMDGGDFDEFIVEHSGEDITDYLSPSVIENLQELAEDWKGC